MTEEELYNKVLDASVENFQGEFHEYLGITKEQYKKEIHCKYCKKPKWKRKYCDAPHPYGCIINVGPMWREEEKRKNYV